MSKCYKCGKSIKGKLPVLCDACHAKAKADIASRTSNSVGCLSCDTDFENSTADYGTGIAKTNQAGGGRRVIRKSSPLS